MSLAPPPVFRALGVDYSFLVRKLLADFSFAKVASLYVFDDGRFSKRMECGNDV